MYVEDGNGSCDCERAEYFDIEEDVPCGDTRFKLIDIGKIEERRDEDEDGADC